MKYIVIKSNKILRVYDTNEGESGVRKALSNIGIIEYDGIKLIDKYETFINIDENKFYSGKIKPYNGMELITIEPEIKDGYLVKWNGKSWDYIKDINGEWYHKETQEMIQISNNETDEDINLYTKLKPDDLSKWDTDKWVFDYELYRNMTSEQLRFKCRQEREVFFPDSVKDNLLTGITYNNPLLTIENYKAIASIYMNIVHTNEPEIQSATTKTEIDTLFGSIKFPTLDDIMRAI
jgi:hypothetical protein